MLNTFKKLLNITLAVCICFACVLNANAQNTSGLYLSVSNKTVSAGETFDVDVTVSQNTGLIALKLVIVYDDSVLSLNSVTDSGMFGESVSYNNSCSPCEIVWENSTAGSDIASTGKLLTLNFTAKSVIKDTDTDILISLKSANDCLDKDLNQVPLIVDGGSVSVSGLNVTKGDLDGDSDVDSDDAIYLLYHTALSAEQYPLNQDCDFNGDGIVNEDDAIYLLYYSLFGSTLYPINR